MTNNKFDNYGWQEVKYRRNARYNNNLNINENKDRYQVNNKNREIPLTNRFSGIPYFYTNSSEYDDNNDIPEIVPQKNNKGITANKDTQANTNRIFVNKNPERNTLGLPLRNVAEPIGNSYDRYKNGSRKIAILSASISKPIDMIKFNNAIVNGSAIKRSFGGATASMLNYYSHEIINEYKPDTVIIMAGTNNFSKKRHQSAQQIAEEIMQIVETFQRNGIKNILISSIPCRPRFQNKVDIVNDLLQHYAGIYKYEYIDNGCINEKHLLNEGRKDNVHLNKEGINILSNNFITHLNKPSATLPFESIWD